MQSDPYDLDETGADRPESAINSEDGLEKIYNYTGKPVGNPNKARIFPPKDIPEKHAKLDAMDKFRMPPATPKEAKIRKQVSKHNAGLDPMDKLRNHHLKDKEGDLVREVSDASAVESTGVS